jgi:hypothetical protein
MPQAFQKPTLSSSEGFRPEDGSNIFLRNVDIYLRLHTALQPTQNKTLRSYSILNSSRKTGARTLPSVQSITAHQQMHINNFRGSSYHSLLLTCDHWFT